MQGAAAVSLVSSGVTSESSANAYRDQPVVPIGDGIDRVLDSYQNLVEAVRAETRIPVPRQITNGDEQNFPARRRHDDARGVIKLVNPLAGVAFDLQGTDSHQTMIPAFPSVKRQQLPDHSAEL